MENLIENLGKLVLMAGALMILPMLGTLVGSFAGWAVGLFFEGTILGIAGQLGITDVAMWQLGAFLGFVGGFLKTKVSADVKMEK